MGAAVKYPVGVPTLDLIASTPDCLDRLPYDALTALRAKAAATLALVESAQLLAANRPNSKGKIIENDKMLTADEAAALLHKDRRWLYRNAHRLPFVRRVSRKSILISESGLQQWLAAH
jgi:HD superfamily phosphodiesterase